MKRNTVITILIALVALVIVLYSFMGTDEAGYEQKILKQREEKDNYMRTASDSPFAGNTENFTGLNYFPPDNQFRVKARLIPIEDKKAVVLPTSDNKTKRYMEYAHAEFNLGGNTYRLLILEIIDMGPYKGTLFLAFGDETSARETYGAGRYLDVKKPKGQNSIVLDFNEAYNPYCAYNDTYSCPLPPQENLLPVAIQAGEKNYHE
ncbi:MAG: DUF1684 domain-containing protein [Cyclobacteriaceae bacterium]|jgi:hypothetical protein|nr:DUF1684 domain-containing protein [Cyclobacteriaceae bacterium]